MTDNQGEHAVQLDYGMVDADNHYYEPTDALTRYLPDERRRDVYWVSEVDSGRKRLVIGGRVWEYLANPTFDPIVKPGLLDRQRHRTDRQPPRVPGPGQARRPLGRAGRRPVADVSDPDERPRGDRREQPAAARRPGLVFQPVARRRLGLQLPEPHLQRAAVRSHRSPAVGGNAGMGAGSRRPGDPRRRRPDPQ